LTTEQPASNALLTCAPHFSVWGGAHDMRTKAISGLISSIFGMCEMSLS